MHIKGGTAKQDCEHALFMKHQQSHSKGDATNSDSMAGVLYRVGEAGIRLKTVAVCGWHCILLPVGATPPSGGEHHWD